VSFEEQLRATESAVAGLRKVAGEASGWSDEQRSRFDAQRLKPLLEAGDRLARALRHADEEVRKAGKQMEAGR
jgi:hypothetical protein